MKNPVKIKKKSYDQKRPADQGVRLCGRLPGSGGFIVSAGLCNFTDDFGLKETSASEETVQPEYKTFGQKEGDEKGRNAGAVAGMVSGGDKIGSYGYQKRKHENDECGTEKAVRRGLDLDLISGFQVQFRAVGQQQFTLARAGCMADSSQAAVFATSPGIEPDMTSLSIQAAYDTDLSHLSSF